MPEKIRRCKTYLESVLGESIRDDYIDESCGDMRVLSINDIDMYHKIAQSLRIDELIKKRNIYYKINLPDESRWAIILSYNNWHFEKKYGDAYIIKRVSQRLPVNDSLIQ